MSGTKKRPGPARAKLLAASDDVIGGPLTGTRSLGGLVRARAPIAPRRGGQHWWRGGPLGAVLRLLKRS